MLQAALQYVLPKPAFKVTPSQPDPIYYTATSFGGYNHKLQTSFSNFNVSTTKFGELPCTPRQKGRNPSASSVCSVSRSHKNSICCCSCNCPYDFPSQSSNGQGFDIGLLTAVASSLFESPSPRRSLSTTKASKRHSTGIWNPSPIPKTYNHKRISQTSQDLELFPSTDDKRLRRTSKRILPSSSSSNEITRFENFDSASRSESKLKSTAHQAFEFFDTLKQNTAIHDPDSSASSCSSFDPSDNEGNYPSTSNTSKTPLPTFSLSSPVSLPTRTQTRSFQAYSDNFPPAFELSPIMEDTTYAYGDVDDILAYYSDSPILGRANESHDYAEFGFDEADWDPEPIFDVESKFDLNSTDADEDPAVPTITKRVKQMSFILKSIDDSLSDATKEAEKTTVEDLLQPPALTLTLPTPEILSVATSPELLPLRFPEPNQLSPYVSAPQTPPSCSTRRSQAQASGDIPNALRAFPPTPIPPLPRCTSCGFGFAFDVTGSTDILPRPSRNTNPCGQCQAQWDKCRKWYGKRGWEVDGPGKVKQDISTAPAVGPNDCDVDARTRGTKTRALKRASKRLSLIVEGVFTSDRTSRRVSDIEPLQSDTATMSNLKRSSKRISFVNWVALKYSDDIATTTRSNRADDVALTLPPTQAAADEPVVPIRPITSTSLDDAVPEPVAKNIWRSRLLDTFFSRSKAKATKKLRSQEKSGRERRRRSFLDLGTH